MSATWRRRLRSLGVCLFSVWLVSAGIAWACRYTVRDIGFVDLRGAEYSLVLADVEDETPAAARFHLPKAWGDRLSRALGGSNLRWGWGETLAGATTLPSGREGARQVTATLVDRQGRRLQIERWGGDAVRGEPRAADDLDALIRLLFSPTRERLAGEGVGAFAQLIVLEGTDRDANERAWRVAEEAAAAIRKIEPMLPRPIAFPIQVERIELAERIADPVFEWACGREIAVAGDVADPPQEAVLAVVYGRGRLAGPAMVGDEIRLHETLAQLALVGESCECETDRGWVEERILPHRWDADERQRAATWLGFDPESPLVRAEMIRIVSQGMRDQAARKEGQVGAGESSPRTAAGAIERWLLGYTESELRAYAEEGSQEPAAGQGGAGQGRAGQSPLSPVRATVIHGDGWDFEESVGEESVAVREEAFSGGTSTSDSVIVEEPFGEVSQRAGRSVSVRLSLVAALVGMLLVTVLLARWVGSRTHS